MLQQAPSKAYGPHSRPCDSRQPLRQATDTHNWADAAPPGSCLTFTVVSNSVARAHTPELAEVIHWHAPCTSAATEIPMTIEATAAVPAKSDSLVPTPFEHSPTVPCQTVIRKVLVLEDDGPLRELVADVFAFEGYFVTEAGDEQDLHAALARISKAGGNHFDLVVLGLQPNGQFNLATLHRLREMGCRTPAIVLANPSREPFDQRMLELDVSFLSKPFVLENLRIVANHVLSTRKRAIELLD